ncbi:unnamed protein product [Chironomus riparius]|uniref:Claspin n=1 Tax=Chironomus riparius TaxID=315576 RepID=A0A9N9RYM1_9DIPT|nr:unnamed protein product [Chironomus riparius]
MASLDSLDMEEDMTASENTEILSNSIDFEKENADKLLEEKYSLKENVIELKRNSIGLKTLSEMNGKDNLIIDLESGTIKPKKLTGPEMLFQNYLKTQAKPKHKDTVCMNILSIENGKLENQKVEVRLDKEVEFDHSRPGTSREKLKENLRNQILQQRLEKLKKRFVKSETAELEPEDKEHFPHKKEDIDEDYNPENDNSGDESAQETTSDEEEDAVTQNKSKKKSDGSKFLDEEAVDEDENEEESSESESESSDDDEAEIDQPNTAQKKSRILKAFEDSDDEESKVNTKAQTDEVDNVQLQAQSNDQNEKEFSQNLQVSEDLFNSQATDFTFNEPSVSEEIDGNNINALFDPPSQAIENDDDLMGLCSGQFVSTPSEIILTNNDFKFSQNITAAESQDDFSDFITQVPDKAIQDNDSFVMDVSDRIENQPGLQNPTENDSNVTEMNSEVNHESNKVHPIKKLNKLLESTDEETEENAVNRKKKLTKRKNKKNKVKKLGFSDDEDESDQNAVDADLLDEESLIDMPESELDEPETYVDYDSEENEVQVKLTKKERLKAAKDYFEKEAELSEEEWQSADEDEKGLDNYEMDLADEEQFDQNKLREEVGRIHARKMMDEDAKDLKKIENLLFENEEDDGIGRERKFRWKNQAEGFTMVDENARDADDIEGEQEEENEILWRKMRHEREMLINEQSQKMADSETMSTDILLLDQSSQTVTTANTSTLVKRKFKIIKTNSPSIGLNLSSENSKSESSFLIKAVSTKKFTHSSFLSRDEHTLTKIASFITTKDDEVTNLSSHGGNSMSFAPIEKKEEPSKKRKSEVTVNRENTSGKKRKVENQRFLLDQLK